MADAATDPQAPSLPYTWTDRDGDVLRVARYVGVQGYVTVSTDIGPRTAYVPTGDEAVRLARAVLAAAGSTARVVEGEALILDPAEASRAVARGLNRSDLAQQRGHVDDVMTQLCQASGWLPRTGEDTPSPAEKPDNISSEDPAGLRSAPTITVPIEMQDRILDRLDRLESEAAHSDSRLRTTTSSEEAAPQTDGGVDLEAIRERAHHVAEYASPSAEDEVLRTDVPALLAEVDRLRRERDQAHHQARDEVTWLEGARQRLTRERDEAALVARYRRLQRDRYRTAWVSARGRAARARDQRDQARADLRMAVERDEEIVQDAREAGAQAPAAGEVADVVIALRERERQHTQEITRLGQTVAELGRDVGDLRERLAPLEQERDDARRRDEARAERDRYRDSWTSARRELATRVERLEAAQTDHDRRADRHTDRITALERVARGVTRTDPPQPGLHAEEDQITQWWLEHEGGGGHDAEENR